MPWRSTRRLSCWRIARLTSGWTRFAKSTPATAKAYARVAHHLELNYRFEDAIVYYRKAIEADPRLWSARSQLGISLMRLGQEDEPRKQLEMCYNNGYRDAATVNSLRLLDSYKNFVTYQENGTILRLRKNEADLLHPYFEAELQRIIPTYEKKYKMKLTGPVQVEVYPDHEDFAVRTMGMPGLGALGVTFGQVVAMDSPSARKPGDFNWGSTLWHEMSHVYILSATNRRVPRWFTEGLAVHEETQVSPEWGDRVSPEILVAIRDKKLLPVAQARPRFHFPGVSSAGGGFLFRGRQYLRLHQGSLERRQTARHGAFLRAAQDHSRSHSSESRHGSGRIRQAISGCG